MTCPTQARLRAHVDLADDDVTAHVAHCPACAQRVTETRGDARVAARAVGGLDTVTVPAPDIDAALRAVRPTTPPAVRRWRRLPAAVAAGVVLLMVAVLVVTPGGRQAAAAFLDSFRAERFQVVTFDPNRPVPSVDGFEGLDRIVSIDADEPDASRLTEVDSLAAAADVAGFTPAPASNLPAAATLDQIQASAPTTVRLTFRPTAPDLPADLRGAQLIVSVPGAAASTYDVDGDLLVVGEAGQLAVDAEGADLGRIRQYLLDRPEVPDDVARQLLAIDDWTTTLPLPVPVDEVVWKDTTVDGGPGLMLQDPMGSGLLWQADGHVRGIAGEGMDVDALRRIADGG